MWTIGLIYELIESGKIKLDMKIVHIIVEMKKAAFAAFCTRYPCLNRDTRLTANSDLNRDVSTSSHFNL